MGVLTAVRGLTTESDDGTDNQDRRARCRNCGRYYAAEEATCPHCGSGNKILRGAPSGQRPR